MKERKIKLIVEFLSDLPKEDFICGYWVDEELDEYGKIWIYILIDEEWSSRIKQSITNPFPVSLRLVTKIEGKKKQLKKHIFDYFGEEVEVGSHAQKCEED